MSQPGSLAWFARHEWRLAWRDWMHLMTAGRRYRQITLVIWFAAFALFMHLVAFFMVAPYAAQGPHPAKSVLIVISACALLSGSLMLSQAMESVTRAFYSRADLDLILSSPASAHRLFAVRIMAMTVTIIAMALAIAAPFIDMLVLIGGWRWLGAYGVVIATGLVASALAVGLTLLLFRTIGPKRTRLIAQILAAVIGAGFVIGLQVAAILTYGTLSRTAFLQSPALARLAPDLESLLWWPARASLGDLGDLASVLAASAAVLGAAILMGAPRFSDHVIAASSVALAPRREGRTARDFRPSTRSGALRRKEWALLRRDPWLISQTLMQLLYLLPPALLLWRSFAQGTQAPVLIVPVLIMAAGQLAGGLAWLAISGEDAPDMIASAPVTPRQVVAAKIEAVTIAIAMIFVPLLGALAFASPWAALVAGAGIAITTISASAIQLWFRTQAKRSHFRRRQNSSRIATVAEALSSIGWAGTGAVAALGTWLALVPGILALTVLGGAWLISPPRAP